MGIQIFRSDFQPMLIYLCKVSFLTTLNIYKAYFRGRHIRVSHVLGFMQKGWRSYIEKFRHSEAVEGFCCKFIYRDCRV